MTDVPTELSLAEAATHFSPSGIYLNSASMGLPPRCVTVALQALVKAWSLGELAAGEFDDAVRRARASFARLIGVSTECVAIAANVSALVGNVAASLPSEAEVVCAEDDFSSLLYPFLERERAGELRVKVVPLERVVDAIGPQTNLVAVSAVQSADGRLFDRQGLVQACRQHGAASLIDATQALGWLPLKGEDFDYVACAAYKWMLGTKGAAFLATRQELVAGLRPHSAGYYAAEEPWKALYGPPLHLSNSARRLDTSPAWFCWVACAAALEFLERVGVDAIHRHNVTLASTFSQRVGQGPTGSAIVTVPGEQMEAMAFRKIATSQRAGRTRLSFHLYNTLAQVELAADVVNAAKG